MSFNDIVKFFDGWRIDVDKRWKDLDLNLKNIQQIIDSATQDACSTTIEISTPSKKPLYKTTIRTLNGSDNISEYPEERPKDDDVYWKRHKELVDKELDIRKELYIKSIETVGSIIKGTINPINFENIDIAKIVELFIKK